MGARKGCTRRQTGGYRARPSWVCVLTNDGDSTIGLHRRRTAWGSSVTYTGARPPSLLGFLVLGFLVFESRESTTAWSDARWSAAIEAAAAESLISESDPPVCRPPAFPSVGPCPPCAVAPFPPPPPPEPTAFASTAQYITCQLHDIRLPGGMSFSLLLRIELIPRRFELGVVGWWGGGMVGC